MINKNDIISVLSKISISNSKNSIIESILEEVVIDEKKVYVSLLVNNKEEADSFESLASDFAK